MQLRCSPSLYLNLGTCEGYFRHFARASDAWELAQSSLNAWKSVSTRYPTVKYEFYGSDRHFNIWAGLWLFPFPFPTIKASGHYFRFLIRAYNFRVRIQAPTNPSIKVWAAICDPTDRQIDIFQQILLKVNIYKLKNTIYNIKLKYDKNRNNFKIVD